MLDLDVNAYLADSEQKDLLRFLTAGSVDDGKSTLIGRLLHDSQLVFEDDLSKLKVDSQRRGSAGTGEIDYSLLLDGLKAEREQGITIDVAYRYFATPRRKFIIADTPGHEQYTRNMATGASNCNLAIILVDARHGIQPQTCRHSFISVLLGIRHLVLAINKMDAVDYDEAIFKKISQDFSDFASKLELDDLHIMPLSALKGDNVVETSQNMPWYRGAPLLEYLENVHVAGDRNLIDLRFPVQLVQRPNPSFRGYAGTVVSGIVRSGQEIMVLPSGHRSRIASIITWEGELEEAVPPMAVTLTLEDELDISRGDTLVQPHNVPTVGRDVEVMAVWMNEKPLRKGSVYLIKHGTREITAEVESIRYRVDVNTLHREEADTLQLNDIGRLQLRLRQPICYDPYTLNRETGSLVFIDRTTLETMGAGMVLARQASPLVQDGGPTGEPRSKHLHSHTSQVTAEERCERLGHQAVTIWFTGLPKAGKSTIAYALERALFDRDCLVTVLDGENLRQGVSADLGFEADDRAEHLYRAACVANLLNATGAIALAAFVSPYRRDRVRAREMVGGHFLEIFVDAPLELCEERDTDGLYEKGRSGEIEMVTGVTAPYESPVDPDLHLHTDTLSLDACVDAILQALQERGWIAAQE